MRAAILPIATLIALLQSQTPAPAPATAPASRPASLPDTRPGRAPGEYPVEIDADRVPSIRTGGTVLIKNATVLPVTSPMIERASIYIKNGRIVAFGSDVSAPPDTVEIDARGMFAVPGSVDCHSHLAIAGGVNEMNDAITAECKIADVIDPSDPSIYRALAGGCTSARLLHGSANAIGGEHAFIKLKFNRTARELVLTDAPRGIKFALGENPKQSNFRAPGRPLRYPVTRMGVEAVIRRSFEEARDLIQQKKADLEVIARGEFSIPRRDDRRLETIAGILSGAVSIHSHCYRADEILMLLNLAEEFGVRVRTLQHVLEGYKVAPEMARHGVGASTFSDWWAFKVEAYDAIPYNAALMVRAGVLTTINSDSDELIRRLHLDSGKLIRYGMLTPDECLATVTINTARQLGLERRIGSIEAGKDGDIALFDAHPLSVEAKCRYTIVDGEVEFERREVWAPFISELNKKPRVRASAYEWASNTPWAPAPPVPAEPYQKIAIIRATVVPVSQPAFTDGTILIENGVISSMGSGLAAPSDYKIIDARGLFVYPGLIDAWSQIGLTEIGSVVATHDRAEEDPHQPDLRASRAIHAESEHIRVARANGITTSHVVAGGGLLSGRSAVVHLDGWTPAHMLLADPLALRVQFPAQRADDPEKSDAENRKEREKVYKSSTKDLKSWLERAMASAGGSASLLMDPKLDALAPHALGGRPFIFEAGSARDAVAAVRFASENRLQAILYMSPHEVYKIAAFLAEQGIPVILGPVTLLPASADDPYDTVYSAPAVLAAAGVTFAFGMSDSANARNLPFQAGMATAYGLSMEDAIASVTIDAARILGIDKKTGSLEPGKMADLIITDGNPLEVRTHVKHMLIEGREVRLDTRQTENYQKYLQRLTPEQREKAGPPR